MKWLGRSSAWLVAWSIVSACAGRSSDRIGGTEYSVMSLVLRRDSVVVADSTEAVCEAGCDWMGSGDVPDAWADFVAKNRRASAIDRGALAERRVRLVHRPAPDAGPCQGPPLAVVSRVGFNADTTEAIFQFSLGPGNRAGSDCDYEAGMLHLKRRPGRTIWRVVKVQRSWLARKGRDLPPQRISQADRVPLSTRGV